MRVGSLHVIVEKEMLRFEAIKDEKFVLGIVFSLCQNVDMTQVESLTVLLKDVVKELGAVMEINNKMFPRCANCGEKFLNDSTVVQVRDAHQAGYCGPVCLREHIQRCQGSVL